MHCGSMNNSPCQKSRKNGPHIFIHPHDNMSVVGPAYQSGQGSRKCESLSRWCGLKLAPDLVRPADLRVFIVLHMLYPLVYLPVTYVHISLLRSVSLHQELLGVTESKL